MATSSALAEWCRATCARYPGVDIKDMSTSFRDGLAFCALIHKHRPDLIDFSSLSRHNSYLNNKLAFEVAETKLGISALLEPKDMVSSKVPDCLSIITYVSQLHSFFNSRPPAGPASLRSAHVNLISQSPDGLKRQKNSSYLVKSKSPQTVCKLCSQPVHLIQRRLVDGELYHRSCFRCAVCLCTLLPDFYSQGSEAGSLICSHHVTDRKSSQLAGPTESKRSFQAGYVSLSGLAISSVPHYTMKTESQDKPVCETAKTEVTGRQERSREETDAPAGPRSMVTKPAPPPLPPPSGEDRTMEGGGQAGPEHAVADTRLQQEETQTLQLCVRVTGGGGRPVPAPRRKSDLPSVPVPAPRVKTSQTTSRSPAAGDAASQRESPPTPPPHTQKDSSSTRGKLSHPWLGIIHPGPWTQLPPAPPPVTSRLHPNLPASWYRPRLPPPNPFAEDVDEKPREKEAEREPEDHDDPADADVAGDAEMMPVPPMRPEGARADAVEATISSSLGGSLLHSSSEPGGPTAADRPVTSCQSRRTCKENPFDRKSETFQGPPPHRAPAPGHGFPLVRRKVQTERSASTEDLQVELGELNQQLELLEQRGVEMEKNLRECNNDTNKEQMLMEWFSLIRERQVVVRRDTELVYLRKEQKLEEKQADVEYELRCLLNKPESDWSQADRVREQLLMDELVAVIEQRNQLVSSLDRDRRREREEDVVWKAMTTNKELQKEGLKELKKSKGKLKPSKVFKMLSQKAASPKHSVDKKS